MASERKSVQDSVVDRREIGPRLGRELTRVLAEGNKLVRIKGKDARV